MLYIGLFTFMITTILSNVLATGLLLTSTVVSSAPAPAAAISDFTFTQVLSEDNFVAYTIQKDETLESVAHVRYGDAAYWTTLWNDNEWVDDPNALPEGLLLKIRVETPGEPDKTIAKLMPEEDVSVESPINTVATELVVESTVIPTATPVPATPIAVSSAPSVVAAPATYDEVYKQAGDKYGIPWQVLYGLHMTETGGRDGMIMNGSGSGARGPMQFMPGTWRAYGADGNGDGVADIDNAVDAIHGAANYLAKHGNLDQGLRSYGGNYSGTLAHARDKGYSQ